MALNVAKALLCKNRFDSFQAAEADEGDSLAICKWRADSFAAASEAEAMAKDRAEVRRSSRQTLPAGKLSKGTSDRSSKARSREAEAAYLEALAKQRGAQESFQSSFQSQREPRASEGA